MIEDMYDPRYRGAMTFYLGTPRVRYVLIDPETRSHSEGYIPRADLATAIPELLGTDQLVKVQLDDDNELTIMALHDIYAQREAPEEAAFWYHPKHTARGIRYTGKALVLAHSPDHKRAVSCRIAMDALGWMFPFDEPVPEPESLGLKRVLQPGREAVEKMMEGLQQVADAADGKPPGLIDLEVDSRCAIAVLELIAAHLDDYRHKELSDNDHAVLPFFSGVYNTLVEHGYLDPDIQSPTLTHWIEVFGQ